jgi:lipopolysaccharide biosynthesis protein
MDDRSDAVTELDSPTLLAFYLPQYHPIPENDQWWGTGFTEWTNVAKARPQFRGHYQPHLPADLGFYDLRVPEVRERQAALAAAAGIGGFAYYHYWFNGRRLLERPVDDNIRSGKPDFPFLLVWANENWTRRWDGGDNEILMAQHYSAEDDLRHIRSLRPALTDDRYLCRSGKPVFAVYRSSQLPNPVATTERWRAEAERWGLPGLYLLRIESFPDELGDPRSLGFDAAVLFQPSWENIPELPVRFRARRRLSRLNPRFTHRVLPYRELVELAMAHAAPPYPRWPGVTPGFDNFPRHRRTATILLDPSPDVYQKWLTNALQRSREVALEYESRPDGLVFINAWNEWAEGNHLEPDQRYGHRFLDATAAAVAASAQPVAGEARQLTPQG